MLVSNTVVVEVVVVVYSGNIGNMTITPHT